MIAVRSKPRLVWLWTMSAGGRVGRDHPVGLLAGAERPVAAAVEARGRDDGQPACGERPGQRGERPAVVDLDRQHQQVVAVDLG
jgi:hypothetical protein